MDQIPSEITKIIISFMDNNTKLHFRATNKQWFKYVDYRDFTLYFTRKVDLPYIADTFARYQTPISLSFKKQHQFFPFLEFAEHFTKLTSLTGLDLPQFSVTDLVAPELLGKEYMILTTLSNLKSLDNKANRFATRGYDILKIAQNFSNLTSLKVSPVQIIYGRSKASMEEAIPVLQRNPHLVELDLCVQNFHVDQHFVDSLTNNRKLTKLCLLSEQITYSTCDMYSALSAVKELQVHSRGYFVNPSSADLATYGQLTNLESLHFNARAPMDESISKLVNLTQLHLTGGVNFTDEWARFFNLLAHLTKLKHVTLEDVQTNYEFLSALTALENLSTKRIYESDYNGPILQQIHSTHLTRLEIDSVIAPFSFDGPYQTLINVRELSLNRTQTLDNSFLESLFHSMPHLTKLDYVSNASVEGDEVAIMEKLSSLRSLRYRYDGDAPLKGRKMRLKQLTDIEELDVSLEVEPTDLQYCRHLTALDCHIDIKPGGYYNYLATLPLKALQVRNTITDNQLYHAIGRLTGLEYLSLHGVEDEHLLLLSQLVNLTKLFVNDSLNFTGATLGSMTALQELSSSSRNPEPNLAPVQALNLPYLYSIKQWP